MISRFWARSLGAVALFVGYTGCLSAADNPPVTTAGPVTIAGGDPGDCPTCSGGTVKKSHSFFKSPRLLGHLPCKPYTPQLAPGACFGYFQTQWHRWQDVCPLPYQGVGMSDAPPLRSQTIATPAPLTQPTPTKPTTPTTPTTPRSNLPPSKPLNPVPPPTPVPQTPRKLSNMPQSGAISLPEIPRRY